MDIDIDKMESLIYAVIDNDMIANTVVATADYATEQGWIECQAGWRVGDKLALIDGERQKVVVENILTRKEEIIAELDQIDTSISPRTAREAMLGDGIAMEIIALAEERAEELRAELREILYKEDLEK